MANFLLDHSPITCAPNPFTGPPSNKIGMSFTPPITYIYGYYDGGTAYIQGTVTYNNIPASRKVCLFTLKDYRLIATTWSDKETGFYRFDNLLDQPYFVWSEDYLEVYDPISHLVANSQG